MLVPGAFNVGLAAPLLASVAFSSELNYIFALLALSALDHTQGMESEVCLPQSNPLPLSLKRHAFRT